MKVKKRANQKLKNNVRFEALKIIYQIEYKGGYSNVLIDNFLKHSTLSDRDNNLLVNLVYGVLQHRYTLRYYLSPYVNLKKIDDWVLSLLEMTVYQIVYLERIPNHAAVDEAVEIAKINGHGGLGSFVNGVLRNFLRNNLLSFDEISNLVERLSVKYSIEEWIVDELLGHLSLEEVEKLLKSLNEEANISARVQKGPDYVEGIINELTEAGYNVSPSKLSPQGIVLAEGNLIHTDLFKNGEITIQDESSMLVAPLGKLEPDHIVLDACSAPGGKATHIGQYLSEGHLDALDISENKLKKVKEHSVRLGVADQMSFYATDALDFTPPKGQLYDRIYLDAPCSGLGLMRRKPEIKYTKEKQDVKSLGDLQSKLIRHVSQFLKPKGYLIYSTCTLTSLENEDLIAEFLAESDEFVLDPILESELQVKEILNENGQIRIWPHEYHTDGFFISRLKKIK